MGLVLLILLFVLMLAAVPAWPYSRRWGYYPASGLGFLWVLLLMLLIFSIIPWGYPVY